MSLQKFIVFLACTFAYASAEGNGKFQPYPNVEEMGIADGEKFEGDVILPEGEKGTDRNMVTDEKKRWPRVGNYIEVPYTFHSSIDEETKQSILEAIEDYAIWTCIKWVPRSSQSDYVEFFTGNGCYAYAGRYGGKQPLSLGYGCAMSKGIPTHEMMHTMGFMHEQSRSDRDQYITIYEQNMSPGAMSQFHLCESCTLPNYKYDYSSVMHYGSTAFSNNGRETIVPRQPGVVIGQRKGFSELDIKKLSQMYKCGSTTVKSNRGHIIPSKAKMDQWRNCPKQSKCGNPFDNYQYLRLCEKTCDGVNQGDNYDSWDECETQKNRCNEASWREGCSYSCNGGRLR